MKRILVSILITILLQGIIPAQQPSGNPRVDQDLEADIRKARLGGKYQKLLRVLRVESDVSEHGTFHDLGIQKSRDYKGFKNIPRGYWVYIHPNWFVWGSETPRREHGPEQATGAPDTDFRKKGTPPPTAWIPGETGGKPGWLKLDYAAPVHPLAILLFQWNPGLVARIDAIDRDGNESPIWVNNSPARVCWRPGLTLVPVVARKPVDRIRLLLAPKITKGVGAVDAAGLLDRTGRIHWAVSAEASSHLEAGEPTISRRSLLRRFGGHGTAPAVDLALDWLARHQDSDEGYWDCDGYQEQCKGNICAGKGYPLYDPGTTGLALLAYLGAGHTHQAGKYKKTVANAIKYIKRIQDPEGCFGTQTGHFMYSHIICLLAISEAYGMSSSPLLRRPMEKALAFLLNAQNPNPSGRGKLAWRYTVQPGDNDTSVTSWAVMALKSARMSGVEIDAEVFRGVRQWIDLMTDPKCGRVGYVQSGISPVRAPGREEKWPRSTSEAITAAGMLCRILLGESPDTSRPIQLGTELILSRLPEWNLKKGTVDPYYWYYGTLAMFQVGGNSWKKWNRAMKSAIVEHQCKHGCEKGSWDPLGPWGEDGGRVYMTALMTLCLEVYYRYEKSQNG